MQNLYLVASLWVGLALLASLVSIRFGLSVAMAEILVGAIAGNLLGVQNTPWTDFLATTGAVVLTFLAGAEIDPVSFRRHLKPSLAIGTIAFLFPFLGAAAFARFLAGWQADAAWIAGIALSTTSVAVVYAVMLETGLNQTELGKLILAACFVNDLGTVLALGALFANFSLWVIPAVGITGVALWLLPRTARGLLKRWGGRVSEAEIKFLLLVLFALGALANAVKSEAVLPAYLAGLAMAGLFHQNRTLALRLRTIAFALLTPFYFLKAGSLVSAAEVASGALLILALLAMKMLSKSLGVYPTARLFKMGNRRAIYTTLLMSTGLTFGTISALFGLNNGIIDRAQYSVLVTVVIGSAVVPTLIAQTWFQPRGVPAATLAEQETVSSHKGHGLTQT
jgi:Kef-type K+ transport system membrane component KefB